MKKNKIDNHKILITWKVFILHVISLQKEKMSEVTLHHDSIYLYIIILKPFNIKYMSIKIYTKLFNQAHQETWRFLQ